MSYINIVLDGYVMDLNMDKLTDEQVLEFKDAVRAYDKDPDANYIEDLDIFYDTQINADTVQTLRGYYDFALDAYLRRFDDDGQRITDLEGDDEVFFEEIASSAADDPSFLEEISGLDLEDGYYFVAQRVSKCTDSFIVECDEEIDELDPFALEDEVAIDVCTISELPTVMGREINTDSYNIITNMSYKGEYFLNEVDESPIYDTIFSTDKVKEDVLIIFQVVEGHLSIVYTYDAFSDEPEHFYDHIDKTLVDMPIYQNNLIQQIYLEGDDYYEEDEVDDEDYDDEDSFDGEDFDESLDDDYEDDDDEYASSRKKDRRRYEGGKSDKEDDNF